MHPNGKIYVAGHRGMVGSAILRRLETLGYSTLVFRSHAELDLTNQDQVSRFFEQEKPDYVFLAAAKVGGIHANNTFRADFIYQNLMLEANIIHQAYLNGVKKLLFLGSSCIYPKECPQPIQESALLTGLLEPTNEPYAIAKIAGIKLCESYNRQYGTRFISAMPTNLYGPNDNYDLNNSHVLPALIRKFHEAKLNQAPSVEIWGTGRPRREFLYVEDLAEALVFLMQHYDGDEIVNVGTGTDLTISELAALVKEIVGFTGALTFNTDKPDGTMVKRLDVSKLAHLGWQAHTSLRDGIAKAYADYQQRVT